MRQALLDALEARYEAEVAEAHAIIKIFLENPVGIGEHPQHLDELDKQFGKIAEAEDGIRDRSPSRGLGDVYKRQ